MRCMGGVWVWCGVVVGWLWGGCGVAVGWLWRGMGADLYRCGLHPSRHCEGASFVEKCTPVLHGVFSMKAWLKLNIV